MLAPPIALRVCRIHPSLYGLFNAFPFLRTHVLCWIGKREGRGQRSEVRGQRAEGRGQRTED
jgi:hypothetical protein